MIRICKHEDKYYSLDNRRLAAFRLVYMLSQDACRTVRCKVVEPRAHEWRKKFSTKSEGRVIIVSRTGGEVVGSSLATTTYREMEEDASDVDSDESDEDDAEEAVTPTLQTRAGRGELQTSVEWKCRVDRRWHPYRPETSSWLEEQFQKCRARADSVGVSDPFELPNHANYRVHFTAERQFRVQDMSLRRPVVRDVQPPALSALTTPARVEEFLQLPNNAFKRTREVVDKVVRTLHALGPSQVYEGGSFKKETCLSYDFDVDLVLWLNGFDHSRMEEYKKQVKAELVKAYPPQGQVPEVWYIGETPYCLKMRFRMVSFDIVITGNPEATAVKNPERFYDATKSQLRDNAIIEAKQKYRYLHHLILLAKCWKKRQEWSKMGGPISYFVERLCVHAMEKASNGCSLPEAFRCFLELCERGIYQIKDPLGKEIAVPADDRTNFQRFATDALAELNEGV